MKKLLWTLPVWVYAAAAVLADAPLWIVLAGLALNVLGYIEARLNPL